MDITIEKRAIVFRISNDSFHLKPLMYFIENSFKTVRYYSNATIVHSTADELIRKQYILKWAYKIYLKSLMHANNLDFGQLSASLHLPIYVISTKNKAIAQVATITVDHITSNALSITCNQHHSEIIPYLKTLLKDSVIHTTLGRGLKIRIKTKNDLLLLKNLLSHKKISNILVNFVTHGLDFNRLYSENSYSEELIYKEKLKKSYMVLSITDNSTKMEIKNNYKKMLRKYHPDRVYNENSDIVQLYTRRFQVIQEAYELIQEHHKVA